MTETLLGRGVYTFRDVARLTGLRYARIREWFVGRGARGQRVFAGDYSPVDGDMAVSFLDLVDAFVAGQLRTHGVPLQTLRRVYARLQDRLGTKHAFAHQELLLSGKDIFARTLNDEGEEELIHVLTDQKVFPRILLPFLEKIDFEEVTKLARRWRIAELVVVDPQIGYGKPVVEPAGIATAVLAAAYHANGRDAELVADWFNVHARHVLAAAKFEGKFAA